MSGSSLPAFHRRRRRLRGLLAAPLARSLARPPLRSGGDFAADPNLSSVGAAAPAAAAAAVHLHRSFRNLRESTSSSSSLACLFVQNQGPPPPPVGRSEGVGRGICPVVDGAVMVMVVVATPPSLRHWTCFSGRSMPQSRRRTAAKKLASLGRPASPASYSHYVRGSAASCDCRAA